MKNAFRSYILGHAAWWVMTANQQETAQEFPSQSSDILASFDHLWENDAGNLFPQAEDIRKFQKHAETIETVPDAEASALIMAYKSYGDAFATNYYGRLLSTSEGYRGMGPELMQVEDSIWLIPGAEVPFVLREKPHLGRFELVGGVYVHGIMHGEACDDAELSPRMIEIE